MIDPQSKACFARAKGGDRTLSSIPAAEYRFERVEKKFWMTDEQYRGLLPTLNAHLKQDRYGDSAVCNIYYDTVDYALIRRSVERPLFKEKLRLRSYGLPEESGKVYVEIKRKLNGIGYKRRIAVPFAEAKKLLRGEAITCSDPQIEGEILAFVRRYRPKPMVFLSYRRTAMTDENDPDLRVTADTELRYRLEDAERPGKNGMKPILEDDSMVLLEIKALGAIPLWLTEEMSRLRIYQAPFSKIGTVYTRHIAPTAAY